MAGSSLSVFSNPLLSLFWLSSLAVTFMNGPTCSADGIILDGNNDYVDIDDFDFGGATTFEVYVKYDSFNNWSRVFSFGESGGDSDNAFMSNDGTTSKILWNVNQGSTGKGFRTSNFDSATWMHVAVTFKGTNPIRCALVVPAGLDSVRWWVVNADRDLRINDKESYLVGGQSSEAGGRVFYICRKIKSLFSNRDYLLESFEGTLKNGRQYVVCRSLEDDHLQIDDLRAEMEHEGEHQVFSEFGPGGGWGGDGGV